MGGGVAELSLATLPTRQPLVRKLTLYRSSHLPVMTSQYGAVGAVWCSVSGLATLPLAYDDVTGCVDRVVVWLTWCSCVVVSNIPHTHTLYVDGTLSHSLSRPPLAAPLPHLHGALRPPQVLK